MTRPTCSTCPYYDADATTDVTTFPDMGRDSFAMPPRAGRETLTGLCCIEPVPLHKRPDQWCGQHPGFPAYVAFWRPREP